MSNINDWRNHPLCKKIKNVTSNNIGESVIEYLNRSTNSLKYEYLMASTSNEISQILKNGEVLFSWRPFVDKLDGRWTKLLILVETEERLHKLQLLED